jgi:uncharacterized membrane protein YraQ (UPF0718 family)
LNPQGLSRFRTLLPYLLVWCIGFVIGWVVIWLFVPQIELSVLRSWISDRIATFTTVFLGIFIEAVPFLLLGTMASGLVEVFLRRDWLLQRLPGHPIVGAVLGGSMGMIFPVCECGTVPLTRRLIAKGLPASIGIAFLLAAPVVNPIVIASTIAAFGMSHMVLWRVLLSLFIAVLVGVIFSVENRTSHLLRSTGSHHHHPMTFEEVVDGNRVYSRTRQLQQAMAIAGDEFFEMGRYLVLGALLASLMQAFLPQALLLGISKGPVLSVLVMIALAVVLSVCSTVDSFVALAFVGSFTPGSILAFLVFGAMIDIKSVFMYSGVFQRRVVLYLILLPFFLTLIVSVSINLFLPWF